LVEKGKKGQASNHNKVFCRPLKENAQGHYPEEGVQKGKKTSYLAHILGPILSRNSYDWVLSNETSGGKLSQMT